MSFTFAGDVVAELARAGFTAEQMRLHNAPTNFIIEVAPHGVTVTVCVEGRAEIERVVEWDDFKRAGVLIDALVSAETEARS